MKNFKSAALMAAACALGFGAASVAGAQTADAAPKLVIHYSPASLDTERGVRHLYERLVSAAEKVCDQPQVGRFASSAVIECRKQAIAGAVAQIHNARLADLSAGYVKKG
jgi:UrcA family protein